MNEHVGQANGVKACLVGCHCIWKNRNTSRIFIVSTSAKTNKTRSDPVGPPTGNVTIGNYEKGFIDMADIAKFPVSLPDWIVVGTQFSTFGHELFEQMHKQAWGLGNSNAEYVGAHRFAMSMESALAGGWRGESVMNGSSLDLTWYSGLRIMTQQIDFSSPGVVSGVSF